MHCKYFPLSHTKPWKTFLRLCISRMGQRKVLTVRIFSWRICSRVNIAIHKNRKITCLFTTLLGAIPRSSILNKFRKSSIPKEHASISVGYQLKRRKRRRKRHIVSFISVGKESFWRIVVKYLGITIIKVCEKIISFTMQSGTSKCECYHNC